MPNFPPKTKFVTIMLFTGPVKTLRLFGIKAKLQREDWVHVKDFPFGELGFDYEEGLRFYVPLKSLPDAVAYLRQFKQLPTEAVVFELNEQSPHGGYFTHREATAKKVFSKVNLQFRNIGMFSNSWTL